MTLDPLHVTLIATGGTIASQASKPGGPVTAQLAGETLLSRLRGRAAELSIRIEEFAALGSFALDLATVHALAQRVRAALEDPCCQGVVVTHGTDTMEETAFALDLLVGGDRPVVLTGAQRHAGDPDSDGPRNLADALLVAASPAARGLGTLILFEGDLHAARDVTKTHSARTDTFRSGSLGKLGEVDREQVFIYRRPRRCTAIAAARLEERVELMRLTLGARPDVLDWWLGQGVRGVVIEAFGRGNAPPGFAAAISRLFAQGVPVVIASRCSEGRTAPIYGGDSGGTSLAEVGAIFAGDLAGHKARLLLAAFLGAGHDLGEIRAGFSQMYHS